VSTENLQATLDRLEAQRFDPTLPASYRASLPERISKLREVIAADPHVPGSAEVVDPYEGGHFDRDGADDAPDEEER
jgi:hypothetical protein